jgi:hypothetical protein
MAISTGSKILAQDFNTLQTNVVNIIGAGSGNTGYGLTYSAAAPNGSTYISQPVNINKIYAANFQAPQTSDWAKLKTDILLAANHQGTNTDPSILSLIGASFTGTISGTTLTVSNLTGTINTNDAVFGTGVANGTYIVSGTNPTFIVSVSQNISSTTMKSGGNFAAGDKITARSINTFTNAYTVINNNKFSLAQYSDETFSPDISNSRTTAWGSPSKSYINHNFTIDFGSAANARYFFNSGSSIKISGSRSGGSGSSQDTNWTNLLSNMGIITFNYLNTTYSGTSGTGSSIGFYNLTSSSQTIFSASGTGNYATNTYNIQASCDVSSNTNGGARYLYITITLTDTHSNAFSDSVDGTLTSTINMRRATGSYVSVQKPTAANTTLLSA